MKNNKGFTMVEMIIVLAIIAVLAMVVIPAISGYMEESDKDYNKKLVSQLEISGKNYYSENKNELPNKSYDRIALITNSHVALPTLQSGNYVSKDFVDSEGRHCTESYVYVRQPSGSTENEYHPCLICVGDDGTVVNHTESDPYCNVSNWSDDTNPNCNMSAEVVVDGNSKVVEGPNGSKTFYNPSKLKIQANENIAYIIIKGYENGTNKEITSASKTLVTSNMTAEQIREMNLIEFFPKENGKIVTARYEITVLDFGGNESRCLMDPNSGGSQSDITIIMDEEAPTCAIKDYQEVANNKYIKFTKVNDNWSKQENISVLINKNSSATREEMNNSNRFSSYEYSLAKATDGTYYGHVMDEAGNIGKCDTDGSIKINMHPEEAPYCLFTKDAPTKWLKAGEVANLAVECYVDKSLSSNYDKTKLVSDNKLGTPVISKVVKNKGDNPDRTEYQIKYTATTAKKAGKDYVSVKSGFFKTTNNKVNEAIKSKEIKIDAVPPTIKYSASKTKKDNKWYETSESNPLVITATCTDSNSGVKEFIVNSSVINGTSKEITFKKANNPYTITSKCTDNAGNTPTSSTLKVYTKVFSRDKDCGVELYKECEHEDCKCKTYKSCRTKACDCETIARCSAAGCASSYTYTCYSYSFGSSKTKEGDSYPGNGVSSCNSSNVGKYSRTLISSRQVKTTCAKCKRNDTATTRKNNCSSPRNNTCVKWNYKTLYTWEYKKCNKSSGTCTGCNYYKQSLSKCGCDLRKKCEASACGCKTYKTCRTKGCGVEKYKECWHY